MNELKFRAWDILQKEFVTGYEVYSQVCGWESDETGNHIVLRQDKYKIMQYTGLKDQNGKEIYEGDILADVCIPSIVAWNDNGFQKYTYGDESSWYLLGTKESSEKYNNVLGNIYENPELMEVNNDQR